MQNETPKGLRKTPHSSYARISIALFATLYLAWGGSIAYADTAGINSSSLQKIFAEQRRDQWCWAACIQMIMNYHGVEVEQEDIVRRSYGRDPFGNLPNWPGSFDIITANLNGWGIDYDGDTYGVAAGIVRPGDFLQIPYVLVQELNRDRPVLLAYDSHAVVCTAVKYYDDQNGLPIITSITVRDPWPSQENRAQGGRVTYRGEDLGPRIRTIWTIHVDKN